MKNVFFLLLVSLGLAGCSGDQRLLFINSSIRPIQSMVVVYPGGQRELGPVDEGSLAEVSFRPNAEGSLEVRVLTEDGKQYSAKGGYFTGGIGSDNVVEFKVGQSLEYVGQYKRHK